MSGKRISIQEAASQLDVSVKTLRRRIADGSLPAERMNGRLLRVYQSDVDALMKRVPTAEAS